MIIGTSHITISTNDIDSDIKKYLSSGFNTSFFDSNVENSNIKKPYLTHYKPFHAIALLSGTSGIDLELVEHHKKHVKVNHRLVNIDFDEGCIQQIEYNVYNYDASIKFWTEVLGYNEVKEKDGCCILKKISPIPSWNSRVKLTYTIQKLKRPILDSNGPTSIAFFTTNITSDLEAGKIKGALECTEASNITVNQKRIKIGFIVGPSNEMIELIEVKR